MWVGRPGTFCKGVAPYMTFVLEYATIVVVVSELFAVTHATVPSVVYGKVPFHA